MNVFKKNVLTGSLLIVVFLSTVIGVSAQSQTFLFSGNNPESYQCLDANSGKVTTELPVYDSGEGTFICPSTGEKAIIKPPALQQLEVWFVRILYAIWALVATFSFLLLVYLGYRYMLARGDVTQIQTIRKRIVNYIIGFALVFLAVPILATIFRLLGVNQNVACYELGVGFQFFFSDLCTDPKGTFGSDPCSINPLDADNQGILCNPEQETSKTCSILGGLIGYGFDCLPLVDNSGYTWKLKSGINLKALRVSDPCSVGFEARGFGCSPNGTSAECQTKTYFCSGGEWIID